MFGLDGWPAGTGIFFTGGIQEFSFPVFFSFVPNFSEGKKEDTIASFTRIFTWVYDVTNHFIQYLFR